MSKYYLTRAILVSLLGFLVFSASCCINIGDWPRAKYERTVQLSEPLSAGSTFAVQTHNGSVNVQDTDVSSCDVVATIRAEAPTEEDAKKLAEETSVKLESFENKITAKIYKPVLRSNRSVSVSFEVKVPKDTNLELATHNGSVKITGISGRVHGTTHNGKVTASHVIGNITLQTHNGSVVCEEISGNVNLKTHNGGVKAFYLETAPSVCNISLVTHNGGIELVAPSDLSATVNISTHNGTIKTDLPITLSGELSKRKLVGTIGTGQGNLYLKTHNGSIRIR